MGIGELSQQEAVLKAITECDQRGQQAFLEEHHFGFRIKYFVQHAGALYPAKAVAAVAYGNQFPAAGPLSNGQLSGGESAANAALRALGFTVVALPRPQLPGVPPGTAGLLRRSDSAEVRDLFHRALQELNIPLPSVEDAGRRDLRRLARDLVDGRLSARDAARICCYFFDAWMNKAESDFVGRCCYFDDLIEMVPTEQGPVLEAQLVESARAVLVGEPTRWNSSAIGPFGRYSIFAHPAAISARVAGAPVPLGSPCPAARPLSNAVTHSLDCTLGRDEFRPSTIGRPKSSPLSQSPHMLD